VVVVVVVMGFSENGAAITTHILINFETISHRMTFLKHINYK